MSKTLAVNAGSSSLKWQLYEMPDEKVIAKGIIERIGLNDSITTVKYDGDKEIKQTLDILDHAQAVKILVHTLEELHIIADIEEITGIGHRVVAGGTLFKESTIITTEVLQQIEDLSELAPLHNPAHISGINAFKDLLPNVTEVAVFDTSFHTTMPEKAYRYPIANKYYEDYTIRKYGAHGTSHRYVSYEAAKMLGKPLKDLKLITAHIGNGVSLSAIKDGQSIDTSMGFTPLGGVMMGTRSGEMDASVIPYMIKQDERLKNAQDVIDVLNKESGLIGIFEKSSDLRDVELAYDAGDVKAVLALDMYIDRLKKFIGQYFAVLNGADALVFTAGVGENSTFIREKVINGLSWFGMEINPEKNTRGANGIISMKSSKVKVLVIPTDEELMIARDVERLKNKE